ncbi:MAG TPA: collagen-like protein [Rhodopseudomonas sp.]|uniref:collagen-like triple helix repeat-containing protein n=1 Tax=Rhodopseudomonas sp. TaxID=1078 RepID=UPI002ED9C7E8
MDYLSAIASLLVVLLLGGGSIFIGYLTLSEMTLPAWPAWQRPTLPSFTSEQIRNQVMVATVVVGAIAIVLVALNTRSLKGEPGDPGAPGPQGAAGAPATALRTLVSSSCAKDGCPLTCDATETLVTALCVNGTGTRLTDTLLVENGQLKAKCGGSSSSIIVTCAPK